MSGNPKFDLRLTVGFPDTKVSLTYSHYVQYNEFLVTETLTYYACALKATVPQGCEHQTLAISIKELLVSGGGGEVAVFYINFCLPSKVENFFGHFLKLVIFKVSRRQGHK